ncbi:MAG: V-type ATP synthase subunit I [Bacteroidales bacterium]|nr:V-type ATP synthase subunit I [Bacteroidales bacterium]
MKKYRLLVYHRDYETFLQDLRDLGVVHLIEQKGDVSEEILEQYEEIESINKTIRMLKSMEIKTAQKEAVTDGQEIFEDIAGLNHLLEQQQHTLTQVRKEIQELFPWGDFSYDLLNTMAENDIRVKFYVTPARQFDPQWIKDYPVEVINYTGGHFYFIAVEKGDETVDIPAEEIRLPLRSLSALQEIRDKSLSDIKATKEKLDDHAAASIPALERYRNTLLQRAEYEKARFYTAAEAEDKLRIVEGWVPKNKEKQIVEYLEKASVVYITEKARPEDKPPVLLKNKNFAKKFEMIGELYSLPKYNELDLTPFFAPFYALFFGFCLGDVGYGILISLTALIARSKVAKTLKPVTKLIFYLGLSTILFGFISGTFFGINLYESGLPGYSSLQSYMLAKDTNINNFLFTLSLFLGGIQIMFGLVLKAINETIQYGWKLATGTIGWIILLSGAATVFLLNTYAGIEMEMLKPLLYAALVIGGILILFLNNLKRNILKNFGIGLWESYNMITGVVGDLLSYIRLFALGIASAILGFVFNSLAINMSGDIPVLNIIIMVVILVIGHGINLFMSGIGAFVHPLRLTFVEFYKNAGFSGGGKKYYPFRKII